jgi:hypothetical protein
MSKTPQVFQKITFKNNTIYKPITDEQFETLANDLIPHLNKLAAPKFFDPEFVGAILFNVIHSPEQKEKGGITTKSSIFEGCVEYISRRLSFELSEGLRAKAEAAMEAKKQAEADATKETVEPKEEVQAEAPSH